MSREIITLQLGHYANFVGAHWWNIQESSFDYGDRKHEQNEEEVDHDILFREGMTARGEVTFTPRLVLADLKGGLGTLKSAGVLYDEDQNGAETSVWSGDTCVYEQTPEKKNNFLIELDKPLNGVNGTTKNVVNGTGHSASYDLKKDVKVWSDFLRIHLHPKSTVLINEHFHMSENDPFDLWLKGMNLKSTVEELEERIRFYAEECDLMQGFHFLADSHNGFSGLASSVIPYLHDEFPTKQLVTFPVSPAEFSSDSHIKASKRDLSNSLFLPILLENSSLACPLSLNSGFRSESRTFPHLIYDASLNYHTSAIIASALDTVTLNHRLKGRQGINLDKLCDDVTSASKVLTALSMSMPVALHNCCSREGLLTDPLKGLNRIFDDNPMTCISPLIGDSAIVAEFYSQSTTMRGLKTSFSSSGGSHKQRNNLIDEEVLRHYLDCEYRGSRNSSYIRLSPLRTSVPYPQFFDKSVTHDGSILDSRREMNGHAAKMWHTFTSKTPALPNGTNGVHNSYTNGHTTPNGHSAASKIDVESVPLLTNLQCSSAIANVLKHAAGHLQQSSKRHFSLHGLEPENLDSEIEKLKSLQDEYEAEQVSSDSDGDF